MVLPRLQRDEKEEWVPEITHLGQIPPEDSMSGSQGTGNKFRKTCRLHGQMRPYFTDDFTVINEP